MHIEDQQPRRSGSNQRPIGYWLKHLDRLIDHALEQTLDRDGLTRRHWQVLNVLAEHPAGHSELRTTLAPFLADDPDAEILVSDELVGRGWAVDDGERLQLTDPGRRARDELLARVAATRRRTVQGIGDDEYLATIDVLQRMAANLEDLPAGR